MRRPIIFMFSGQGSQYYQMGRKLYEQNSNFRKWMIRGDKIASEVMGLSILEHLYNDSSKKNDRFDRILYTHPAIFLVEYALTQLIIDMGLEPDFILDASMGGFTALAVAEVLPFETALTAVIEQAKSIEALCPQGGMMAILHTAHLYFETPLLYENLELAGINFPAHFVISGKLQSLFSIKNFLREKKISFQSLPVSHAFHSSLIDPAAVSYKNFLNTIVLQRPKINFISSSYAHTLSSIPQHYFWEIVRTSLQFQKTIQMLEKNAPYLYLDLGPSGTLATFVKYNLSHKSASKSMPVLTPFKQDLKNFEKLKDEIKSLTRI